jgi:hypothetical protein
VNRWHCQPHVRRPAARRRSMPMPIAAPVSALRPARRCKTPSPAAMSATETAKLAGGPRLGRDSSQQFFWQRYATS